MAQLQSVDDLKSYLEGVIDRAGHHAPNVREICLTLAGAVALYKDRGRPLRVRGQAGALKNQLWVYINGSQYTFSYDHDRQAINIKRNSSKGQVIHSFTNGTSIANILQIFDNL